MINGVDFLWGIIAYILLGGVWIFGTQYHRWAVWNQERRWQRKRIRTEKADLRAEEEYRAYLRRLIADDGLLAVIHRVTRSFERLHEEFSGGFSATSSMKEKRCM